MRLLGLHLIKIGFAPRGSVHSQHVRLLRSRNLHTWSRQGRHATINRPASSKSRMSQCYIPPQNKNYIKRSLPSTRMQLIKVKRRHGLMHVGWATQSNSKRSCRGQPRPDTEPLLQASPPRDRRAALPEGTCPG